VLFRFFYVLTTPRASLLYSFIPLTTRAFAQHRGAQSVGFAETVSFAAVAIAAIGPNSKSHFASTHAMCGSVIAIAVTVQLLLGIAASSKEQTGGNGVAADADAAEADAVDSAGLVSAAAPSKQRRKRRRPCCPKVRRRAAHRLFGWGLFTLAIVNVDLGIHQLPMRASLKDRISLGYRVAVLCLVALPMAVLEWRLQRHYWRTGVQACWSWRLHTAVGALRRPAWCGGSAGGGTAADEPSTGGKATIAPRASGAPPGSPGRQRSSPALSPARLLERRISSERRASSEQPSLTPAAALLRAEDRHQTYFHGKGLAEAAAALRDRDVQVLQSDALRAFLRLAPLPRRAQLPQFAELLHVVSHFGSNVPLFYQVRSASTLATYMY